MATTTAVTPPGAKTRNVGTVPCRACNLALLRAALLGPLLRDGSVNLARVTQRFAFSPNAALRFLFSAHPHL